MRNHLKSLVNVLKQPDSVLLGLLMLGTVFLYGIIPSMGLAVFGSPDETAVAVVADRLAQGNGPAIADPLVDEYPWLHPRSWISRGEYIVPVGFLGWPWILSVFNALIAHVAPWVATLLLISSAIPLWKLLESYPRAARVWALLLYVTFPSMVLYGNRSLFPNPAELALALWSTWLIKDLSRAQASGAMAHWSRYLITGLAMGACMVIRPIELLWIVPWWVWAGSGSGPLSDLPFSKGRGRMMAVGVALVVVPVLVHAGFTYGAPWLSGYQLRDNPPPIVQIQSPPVGTSELTFLPYGFHPRNILWNVYWFLLNFLMPWSILLIGAAMFPILELWRRRDGLFPSPFSWRRFATGPFPPLGGGIKGGVCALWTVFTLLLIYGHGRYADHVSPGAVTIGNSFLRYLLPIAPLVAWAVAEIWVRADVRRGARIVATILFASLATFGSYKALAGDDESVLTLRRELIRYASIREAASQWFKPSDVIVSDRSDKIFFPMYRVASPTPPLMDLGRLSREEGLSVGLFARPLNQSGKDAWLKAGLDPVELASFGRERLYLLRTNRP